MYLTIGLIVVFPISVRIYRYMMARHLRHTLGREFGEREKAYTSSTHPPGETP